MAIKTNLELVAKLKEIATKYKTLYVMGCFGAPMTAANKARYINHHSYNARSDRKAMINKATANTFGFDCVCLLKGVLWGWSGDASKVYGGATYCANNVPDIDADMMIKQCSNVSTNFANIEIGEAVWCSGHIGVYIGDGLAVECTPNWANNVQITAVGNIGKKTGYNTRTWVKHGKLPYVTYTKAATTKPATTTNTATEVKAGAKVTIKKGATYGGSARGKAIPSAQLAPKQHTVKKVQTNSGIKEALLSEINSWVAVSSLTVVSGGATATTATTKKVTKGCKVKVKKGAKSYDGVAVASFIYNNVYTVDELVGSRAVLGKSSICTAFNTKDLIVQ